MSDSLRKQLVDTALKWQKTYGVAPAITSAISEYDAATQLVKLDPKDYSAEMQEATAVRKGYDFKYKNKRYQIKANRPSGKPGSKVTKVGNPSNDEWDILIWILYNSEYEMQEAWEWKKSDFRKNFEIKKRLSPSHMRAKGGQKIYPPKKAPF